MNWLAVFALGGTVGVDATSCMQAMLSRPLVAGALAGALTGNPVGGALLGAVLEAFHLAILPIGAARYPETGTGAVAAGVAYSNVAVMTVDPPALLFATIFGLAWGRVGGMSVIWGRRLNERLLERLPAIGAGSYARALERTHRLALLADFGRGGAVSVTGALVGTLVVGAAAGLWGLPPMVALALLSAGVAAVITGTLDLFGGWRERWLLFLLGLLCGSLLLVLK
jgi:mannose/fructose/N-acetylgalactosamine-specific phosphotransferase system component IIC